MAERITDLLLRRRGAVLAALLLMTAALSAGLPRLRFDFSPQAFFETGDDAEAYLRRVNERFGRNDGLVMVVVERPLPGGVLVPGILAYVDRLAGVLAAEPWVLRADALTNVPVVVPPASDGDDLRVEPLGVDATPARIAGNRLLEDLFISRDRAATAVLVDIHKEHDRVGEMEPLMDRLDGLLAAHPPPEGSGARVFVHGLPRLRLDAVRMIRKDQAVLVPVTGALFMVLLAWMFRGRPVAVVGPMAVVGLTVLWLPGLLGLLDEPMNILSNVLPPLLVTLGISDSIHLLMRYGEECGRVATGEAPPGSALHTTFSRMFAATFLTSFTTAIGFASLVVARTQILRDWAWMAASGVMFAWVATILLLPLVLSVRPPFAGPLSAPTEGLVARGTAALGASVVRRPWPWLLGSLAVAAACGAAASRVTVNSAALETFHPDSEVYRRNLAGERAAGGLLPVVISVEADAPGRLKDPDVLRRVWAVQREIESYEGASAALSPASFVRALWTAVEGERPAGDDPLTDPNLPRTAEELAQILLLGEMAGEGLRWGSVVTDDWSALRIVARLEDRGSAWWRAGFVKLEARIAEVFGPLSPDVRVHVTGESVLATRALDWFVEDLLKSVLLAAVTIFGVIALLFRSVRLGLVAVPPNVFPLLCTFAYMGLAGLYLNVNTILTFAISLGIAVDDTIHFLARFREVARDTDDRDAALRTTMRHVGRPIVTSTIVLCFGLSALLLSDFLATTTFAILVLVAIGTALPGDLIILPALLKVTPGVMRAAGRRPA